MHACHILCDKDTSIKAEQNVKRISGFSVPSEPIDVVLNLICPELKDTWNTGTSVVWDVPKVVFFADKYNE